MRTILTFVIGVAFASLTPVIANAQSAPVKDFAVEVGQAQVSIASGATAESTVRVVRSKGWAKNKIEVKLSYTIPGVTATVEPTGTPDEYKVKLVADAGVTPGKYSLMVTGRNVSVSHGSVISVEVSK